jgi:DNA-binding NarL/FixJ family response regulator
MKRKQPATKDSPPTTRRVLIVDDHPFLRVGLAESLGREPGLSVCGACGSAEEALTSVGTLHPDVVVADLNLPGKNGLELIKDLASLCPGLPVIVLSMHDEEIYAERCLRAGGRGYVMKNEGPEKLAVAIRQVLAGGVYVSATTSMRIVEALSGRGRSKTHSPVSKLTDREFEIFEWVGRGASTQDIANRLHVSVKTIETHRMHIKTKLGIGTSTELVAFAARWVGTDG